MRGKTNVGPEAQPLHDTRAKAFDQGIGLCDEAQGDLHAGRTLEVDGDRAAAAVEHVKGPRIEQAERAAGHAAALDAHDLRPHIGKEHGGERAGADAGKLHNLETCERAGHGYVSATVTGRGCLPSMSGKP